MNGLAVLVVLALAQDVAAQPVAVQVSTLTGEQHQGTLTAFTSESITVKTPDGVVTTPTSEVLVVRSANPPLPGTGDAGHDAQAGIDVWLVDGSRLRAQSLASSATAATIQHPALKELQIPLVSIGSVRFGALDSKVEPEWNQLLERSLKKDLLAIRKGDVLDHLDGVIGPVGDMKIRFQLDGENIEVKREKVFGLIYAKREPATRKPLAQLELTSGDRFAVRQIAWTGNAWTAKLVSGLDVIVTPDLFLSLDYSLGKVTYLSDLEPRSQKHVPFFDPGSYRVNEYRRDKNFDGGRISLAERSYPRGLGIHSQTVLKYRLGGDYRRFQALMGIGDEVPYGDVEFVLKGDNKLLFKGEIQATEAGDKGAVRRAPPQQLDIDVSGVVELEILVDFGADKRDVGDRLYLANARVIK